MRAPAALAVSSAANESLVRAKRMALTGRIAAGASHDLNNLLGKIIGLAELAMDGAADRPDACAELETLISVAEKGACLVGRLERCSAQPIGEPRPFDLAALVETACAAAEAVRPTFAHARQPSEGACRVMADEALLRVALDAVLDNASQWGASRIVIQCRTVPMPEGGVAEVTVRDDGTGMEQEILAQAFDPFFTTRQSSGAAGMGLSLARAAVAECGGRIEIETSPGAGTIVRLALPKSV